MAKIKLTKSAVDAAQAQTCDVELRDTIIPSFLCKITPTGRKVFMLQYRTNSGVRRMPALGQFGKSGGYRTLLSARIGNRYVFLHGFPKSDKANVTQDGKKALQFAGKVFLELSAENLSKALQSGVLMEVHCVQDH